MICPKCGGKLYVTAKVDPSDSEIYRRRKCKRCGHNIRTIEFEVELTPEFRHEWFEATQKQRNARNELEDNEKMAEEQVDDFDEFGRDLVYDARI